jgi:hypothetical protein
MPDDIANPECHQITTVQLAVDGKVEQSANPEPLFVVEVKRIAPICLTLMGRFAPRGDRHSRVCGYRIRGQIGIFP